MLMLIQIFLVLIYVIVLKLCKFKVYFFEIFLFVIMAIFVSSITIGPDVDNYLFAYSAKYYVTKDFGLSILMDYSKKIGLNFYEFKYIYVFICISLLFCGLKIIIPNISKVILIYLFFPFLLNVVQIRNFFIISFIILAFAISSRIKNIFLSYVLWMFFILVAATQHIAALCYLPFIFVRDKGTLLFKIMPIMFLLSIAAQFLFQSAFSSIMQQFLFFFDSSSRFDQYSEKTSHYGSFILMLETLGMIFIANKVCFINNFLTLFGNENLFVKNNSDISNRIRNLFLYSSLFWPLYIWGGSFSRLMQPEFILMYVLIVYASQSLIGIPNFFKEHLKTNDLYTKILIVFGILFLLNCKTIWFTHWNDIVLVLMSALKPFNAFFLNK